MKAMETEVTEDRQEPVIRWMTAVSCVAQTLLKPLSAEPTETIDKEWGFHYNFVRNVLDWVTHGARETAASFDGISNAPLWQVAEVGTPLLLFQTEQEMVNAFHRDAERMPSPTDFARKFWLGTVCKAILYKLSEGLTFASVYDAWNGGTSDEEEEIVHISAVPTEAVDIEEGDDDNDMNDDDNDDDVGAEESELGSQEEFGVWGMPTVRIDPQVPVTSHIRSYQGHCNVQTVKDVNFYGLNDEYVVSGSDDGHLFIWDQQTSRIVQILNGDQHVVNVAQGHPIFPMLAVSGIDNSIKIFTPDADADRECLVSSRKRMHEEYQITSVNEITRQQGLRDTFLTRHMLAHIAQRIRERQEGNEFPQDLTSTECAVS